MNPKSITIVGAGTAGLTLARCLRKKGFQPVIVDKLASLPSYSYAITLYPRAYRPLLKILDMDESAFRMRLAVDAASGGTGRLWPVDFSRRSCQDDGVFRAHRGKFEALLREGLEIKLGYTLTNAQMAAKDVTLCFENGQTLRSDLVIGADGVHSQTRHLLMPSSAPKILPFVVFNGKRQISEETYQDMYAASMRGGTLLETRQGSTLLQISVSERTTERTRLSYTYSRPAHDGDKLHKPGRALVGSSEIPEAFYQEIESLTGLQTPFSVTFDAKRMRTDRTLHWLMRTTMIDLSELPQLALDRIVMIGDSIHAQPILGGTGANSAIIDAIEVSELITATGTDGIAGFYDSQYQSWKQEVDDSELNLRSMHSEQHVKDDPRDTSINRRDSML